MKKIYKNPSCKVIRIDSNAMIAQSINEDDIEAMNLMGDGEQLVKRQYKSLWEEEW